MGTRVLLRVELPQGYYDLIRRHINRRTPLSVALIPRNKYEADDYSRIMLRRKILFGNEGRLLEVIICSKCWYDNAKSLLVGEGIKSVFPDISKDGLEKALARYEFLLGKVNSEVLAVGVEWN